MSMWDNVTQLHIEISALCNAVCPSCRRYVIGGYEVLPSINADQVWTLDQVKLRLPANEIKHLKQILVNGNYGDFVTNNEAIDILEYFKQSAPQCDIVVSTNGSARSPEWWADLATRCPNIIVDFCLDGLEDTHVLYRRQTNWHTIIKNAQAFINAGGKAGWTMTVFEHNQHQIEECERLSKYYGFFRFIYRYNSRDQLLARDKFGNASHWIKDAREIKVVRRTVRDHFGYEMKNFNADEFNALQNSRLEKINQGDFKAKQLISGPMVDAKNCPSLTHHTGGHSLYVSARWLVSPCCHISGHLEMEGLSTYIDELNDYMHKSQTSISQMTATDTTTVKDIANKGFDWVYQRLGIVPAGVCSYTCGPRGGFSRSFNDKKVVPIIAS